MANIRNLKENNGNVFYPLTHERAVRDSNGVSLDSKLAGLESKSYVEAWDGSSTPDEENIPSGVVVTYNTTTYTGSLEASASTIGKIYLVKNSGNYDQYITSFDGSNYSWAGIGSTGMDLSGYATDEDLEQLQQDVSENYGEYIETADFIRVVVDKDNRLLYGVKEDGEFVFGKGVPTQVRQFVLEETFGKVDKEDGKGLSSNDYTDKDKDIVNVQELLDNPLWAKVTVDKDYKVLEGINKSGERVENIPVQFPAATIQSEPNELWSYVLTDEGERVIAGVKRSGTAFIGKLEVEQLESPVIEELEKKEEYYHGIYPHNSVVSFIDDDTGIYTPEIWGGIIEETGIKMGFACVTGIMSGDFSDYSPIYAPMSLADLQALYDAGHEVYSHSWSHPAFYADNVTLDMIQEQCQKSRDWLNNNGFTRNSDIIVYPGGLGPTRTAKLAVVRRNYRYGVDTVFNDGTNPDGVNPEPLFNDLSIYRCNGDTMTLAELKATFDVAHQENKLLVIMNHSYELNKDKENQIAKIVSFIRYIQSTNASILPLEEALHQIYGWH